MRRTAQRVVFDKAFRPSLALDWTKGPVLGGGIAFSRATSGWYFTSGGVLTDAGSGNPRFDYNPSTLAALGVLEEQASTNGVRNAVMAGSVDGSPGTAPTNWIVTSTGGSITRTIVGTGTESGIEYIDIRYVLSGAANAFVTFESTTQTVAASGETWTGSTYVKLVSGALTNLALDVSIAGRDSGGSLTESTEAAFTPTSAGLATQKISATRTLNNVSTAYIVNSVRFIGSGAADITLRIGRPQCEQKAIATSSIGSAGAATTRNLDRLTIGTLTPWFNAAGGTIVARVALGLAANGGNQFIARFSDNSYDNAIALNITDTGFAHISTVSGGVYDGVATGSLLVADTFTTIAVSYQSGRLEISQNGSAVTADTSFTFPSGMTRLDLLGDHAGANAPTRAWLKWLRYYPRAITGGALQQLSSLT